MSLSNGVPASRDAVSSDAGRDAAPASPPLAQDGVFRLPEVGIIGGTELTLAPGIDLGRSETWPRKSHFKPSDYQEGEGIFDWSKPDVPQKVRTYLLVPTEDQTRTSASPEKLVELSLSMATHGRNTNAIWVDRTDGDSLQIASGHRRYQAILNAGLKFAWVVQSPQAEQIQGLGQESSHLLAMIDGNRHHEDLSLEDQVAETERYLQSRAKDLGVENGLSEAEKRILLVRELSMTPQQAVNIIALFDLNKDVFLFVERGNISAEDAAALAATVPQNEQVKSVISYLGKTSKGQSLAEALTKPIKDSHPRESGKRAPYLTNEYQPVELEGVDHPIQIRIGCLDRLTQPQIRDALLQVANRYGVKV